MVKHSLWLSAVGGLLLLCPSAKAQAVAFFPTVAPLPDGQIMSVTPVASADRRYVRIGVNASFIGFQGFSTFPVPAAVSGGPNGGVGGIGGGGGGIGGIGGGQAGGGGAVAAGQGPFGGDYLVGMNGVQTRTPPPVSQMPMQGFNPSPGFVPQPNPLMTGALPAGPGFTASVPPARAPQRVAPSKKTSRRGSRPAVKTLKPRPSPANTEPKSP